MSIISEDGGAVNLPADLLKDASTPDTQKNYFEVTITDLNVNTTYPLQFAWVYEDRSVSEYSATYNITTLPEPGIATPSAPTVQWAGNGIISISWNGKDSAGNTMQNFQQVNVWLRGGYYGETYIQTAYTFNAAGTRTFAVPTGTYFAKLQAQSSLGELSAFSAESQSVASKPPSPVTSVTGSWVKDDGTTKTDTLRIGFTFDTTAAETSTNLNANADYFKIILTANSKSRIFYSSVNKTSSSQVFYLTAQENKATFGIFATSFGIEIQVVDSFGNSSTVVPATSLTYTTPLSVPVISVTPEILGYSVSYTSPSADLPFDQIYIYESIGGGAYSQVAQGKSNPIRVSTTNTSTRSVKAVFYDSNGLSTTDSNIVTNVTPNSAFSADNTPPNAPSVGLTATSGIDSTGTLGFNGFVNLSWTAVADATLRGYRIRFRPVTTPASNYSYVDAQGTTYRLAGLAVGTTYEIGIASYDEFNNTSASYSSFTNQVISGTPFIGTNVTTTGYFAASAGGETGEFRFGYGVATGRRGLRLNDHNYWYIDSAASATFKLGGSLQNYILWDGQTFTVDGDITARRGTFSGNITVESGGSVQSFTTTPTTYNITAVSFTATTATYTTSLAHGYAVGARILVSGLSPAGYNGNFSVTASTTNTFTVANNTNTAVSDQSGFVVRVSGAGFVLSRDGLKFNSATVTDITTIDAATGKLTTSSATIGGWDVTSTTITKNGITLNSTGTIIANNASYYVGIKPQVSTAQDIVLWAGQSADGSAANFRVEAGGKLYATGANISGDVVITGGSTLTLINQANTNSTNALNTANTANARGQKFDSTTGNLISGLTLTSAGSIYSNKTSYTSTTTGWFLGWYEWSLGNFTPAINIGGTNSYIKYDGYGQTLEIKGTIVGSSFQTTAAGDGRYIRIEGSGTTDRIFFYAPTAGGRSAGYIAIRSDSVLDLVPPYSGGVVANRLSMDGGANSILYGGSTDAYIRIGANDATISKNTNIQGTLLVNSGPSGSYNVKQIRATSTDATPSGGADGDIVLVYT
jgi:hypothetical protein